MHHVAFDDFGSKLSTWYDGFLLNSRACACILTTPFSTLLRCWPQTGAMAAMSTMPWVEK